MQLTAFKDGKGRALPLASTVPGWAQLVAQGAISFSAMPVLPDGEWFERLPQSPLPGESCLVRVYPPFDLTALIGPLWTLFMPPDADVNGPALAPRDLGGLSLVRLSVTELLNATADEAWLRAQTLEQIALEELPRRFTPVVGGTPLAARSLAASQRHQVRLGNITCVDINIESDLGETLVCLEQDGRQHLVLHRVWSFTEVDIVFAGNRVLSDPEWAAVTGSTSATSCA